MTDIFALEDIHVAYGKVEAVRGVSLSMQAGTITSVIGPNGAGKTTLLAAAIGLLPSTGAVRFKGEDIAHLGVEDRVELGLCLVPETRELFGEMSVVDNLMLGAYARRSARRRMPGLLDDVYDRFPRLAERRDQQADTLSGGERQMLAVGRALMSEPQLLMLDEPSLGLAPLIVIEILDIVKSLRHEGVSVLLVEQNALAALDCSDHGYVLESGELSFSGASAALKADQRIFETYLGGL
ncbi:ABC transporter ATP-binding protein [Zhengella mangrovi]|uniref:ABC transporter ATP-binding protein n=1 Tax=Zhengella mangrovi TaxID=1982044 RepID=A0A2G1QH50_9HYPH|nr:ABC transporter ATP-binding protein [Zhengella mangrovi]PHP64780.1 ABC transporter ATP-binding protein [Zhengella mangrovi]